MTSDDYNAIDHAVFGYSNGHRQLRSSIGLSSMDLYELASISDLAPGARLSPSESYLTGATLPDSKRYALMRTWLAPEMSRPGCVWSHVLLLPRSVLSSQIDLGALNSLFRRPDDFETNDIYSNSLKVLRRSRGEPALVNSVEPLLMSVYLGYPITLDGYAVEEWERAIFALWSQQWPRLRSQFVFRSIASTTALRHQMIQFGDSAGRKPTFKPKWVNYAVPDAVSSRVTPLRRFLWRYGKDIDRPREAFADLVDIFAVSNDPEEINTLADRVFSRFGPGQADTLKSDLFGLGVSSLSLVPTITPVEAVKIISAFHDYQLHEADLSVGRLFVGLSSEQIPDVASAVAENEEKLGVVADDIMRALVPSMSVGVLLSPSFPDHYLYQIMQVRTDLITPAVLERVPSDALYRLCFEASNEILPEVLREILKRQFNRNGSLSILPLLTFILPTAISLYHAHQLGEGWQSAISENTDAVVESLSHLPDAQAVVTCADFLGYPIVGKNAAYNWLEGISKGRLERNDETRMFTYIFVLCIADGLRNNIGVLKRVLPELRRRNLAGELTRQSQDLLGRWLPYYHQSWDLDRRILKLIRQFYKQGDNLDEVVVLLGLADKNYAYATNRAKEDGLDQFKPFQPWSWFR